MISHYLSLAVRAIFVENMALAFFLGMCMFLAVSRTVEMAFGFGVVSDPQTAWLAYHANFIFFTMMACGGLVLTAIYSIVGAHWPGPYRRFAESLA